VIVHTGQHYDPLLSDVFFDELGIPAPDVHLGVGSGSHGVQTGAMLGALDAVITEHSPDWVLVYGDTNSTLAATLSAVKLHVRVAHLEAGLRSFNRRMPEEHNRVLSDHAADLLLAPTEVAVGHLRAEGLEGRTVLVGDVMTDVLFRVRDSAPPAPTILSELGLEPGGYYVSTIHRAENTDDPERLRQIVAALSGLDRPIVLLAHPRVRTRAAQLGIELEGGTLRVHDPLPYADLIAMALSSAGIVTDSGGLQKEAFLLRVPCTTIRTETEWVETVELGWNVLANTPEDVAAAVHAAATARHRRRTVR
jgi:UDP-N-acetylglucosamine 2-epimerase (non-hydrolysing)